MKATCDFARKGAEFVKTHGYVLIDPYSGNRMLWSDWPKWRKIEDLIQQGYKYAFDDATLQEHRKAGAYWERMARNAVTQGTGAAILKTALKKLFDYIVDGGYFGEIKLNAAVHDEITCCYPKSVESFPKDLETIMEESAAIFCHKLPIPAEAAVGDH